MKNSIKKEDVGAGGLVGASCRSAHEYLRADFFFLPNFNGFTCVFGWGTALHSSVRVSACYDWVAPCGCPEVIPSGALIWSASIVPAWSSKGLQRHVVQSDSLSAAESADSCELPAHLHTSYPVHTQITCIHCKTISSWASLYSNTYFSWGDKGYA